MFLYRVLTEWSAEDGRYVARVPALPGASGDGRTAAEATREAQVSAELILESMKQHGRPPPDPDSTADYSGNIRLRLPLTLHRKLSELAAAEDTSLNALMVAALASFASASLSEEPPAGAGGANTAKETAKLLRRAVFLSERASEQTAKIEALITDLATKGERQTRSAVRTKTSPPKVGTAAKRRPATRRSHASHAKS